ncbi:MAG: serine hydrolase [Proteobacteria bacterium]|nr:serine hydrolase [Pseudomonadota bacterium]
MKNLLLCALVSACLHVTGAAAERIDAAELLSNTWSGGVIPNSAFTPGTRAGPAHAPFLGTLQLAETRMHTVPVDFVPPLVLGRDPGLFPAVNLSFFTEGGDLVPYTQDVIRSGTSGRGHSYWDLIVQPGRVWSEHGDEGWSRAAFPFALVNSLEGETHNGLATFLYRHGRVSNLRFQIVQQTAPFYIKQVFVAAGLVTARLAAAPTEEAAALRREYRAGRAAAVPISGWEQLSTRASPADLAQFDGAVPTGDIVLSGLDYRGTFYLKGCPSAGGPLPWCDRARFGVWSATKALANETALLRLAQKYGPAVFDLRIADYVPEATTTRGWSGVRFEDAIDMATGIGNGSLQREPNDALDGYIDASYSRWYEARSTQEKVAALLQDDHAYPWGPGQVARYRDQDMFMLGVAMDRFLKSKEGPAADIWSMLRREVFAPIGIRQAPVNRTLEADGSAGQPLMAYGYYPTVSDMVLIARLYQNRGESGGLQILYAPRIRELLDTRTQRGLRTGERLSGAETTYFNAFWVTSYVARNGCRVFYPRMIGWGGNIVALMPRGITGIRLARGGEDADDSEVDTSAMAQLADSLSGFCNGQHR